MNRRSYLAALGTGVTAGLAGCSAVPGSTLGGVFGGEPCDGEECDIGMTRTEFVPETYEASVGETVVWKNTSEADHTVTAYQTSIFEEEGTDYFASGGYEDFDTAYEKFWNETGGSLSTRETFEHTFEVPGTYSYVCLPHEDGGMVGIVEVVD